MSDPAEPAREPDVRALATFDFSGPEDGRGAFRRIGLGIGLLLLGLAIVVGCAAAWLATLFNQDLWDWADLVSDVAWFLGFVGLVLVVVGFALLRSGRKRRIQALGTGMAVLDAISGDPQPETGKRILPPDAPQPTKPPTPLV